MKIVRQLGALRFALAVLSIVALVMRPAAGGPPVLEGWQLATSLLVPALTPLLFVGLVLDILMTWVMSIDLQVDARGRARSVLWIDFVLLFALGVAWVPYFLTLGN